MSRRNAVTLARHFECPAAQQECLNNLNRLNNPLFKHPIQTSSCFACPCASRHARSSRISLAASNVTRRLADSGKLRQFPVQSVTRRLAPDPSPGAALVIASHVYTFASH